MAFNSNCCLAKVAWRCKKGEFKQCCRKPLPGTNLCGIHSSNLPNGLVVDPVEAAELEEQPAAADEVFDEDMPGEPIEADAANEACETDEADMAGDFSEAGELDDPSEAEGQEPPAKAQKLALAKLPAASSTDVSFNFDNMAQYFNLARAVKPKSCNDQITHYSAFCAQAPKGSLPAHCRALVETDVGQVCLHEDMVMAYLAQLRFQGASVTSRVLPSGHVKQVTNAFKRLQDGVRDCGLDPDDVPNWAVKAPKPIAQLFRDWKTVDMATELPATRKLFVTPQTVEDYCIKVRCRRAPGNSTGRSVEPHCLFSAVHGKCETFLEHASGTRRASQCEARTGMLRWNSMDDFRAKQKMPRTIKHEQWGFAFQSMGCWASAGGKSR